jgi:Bacterial Ig domain
MSSFWLWSGLIRIVRQSISAWRMAVVCVLLCLVTMAGCDVRPFNELFGEDNAEENAADEADEADEEPDTTEQLDLSATPPAIETPQNTPQTIQVSVDEPDLERTYTFAIKTPPVATSGTAIIDVDGSLSFTPSAGFVGTDQVTVTVTDDGLPARSGEITIGITVSAPN